MVDMSAAWIASHGLDLGDGRLAAHTALFYARRMDLRCRAYLQDVLLAML